MEQIIGIDLAKRVFQLHIVSPLGNPVQNKMVSRDKLTAFMTQQPLSRIVIEANYWACQFR
ncbi:hypothetical protein PSI22_12385 [Xenorhabdus sp. XENO-7]|uniref:Transposase n=1 Tax=Xenorhabdus aichiensis TaxID=3025874 RepID=A0ABT5M3Z9_9GAMM|nr:hypothetical protein [Xenorhabdus aichiensis]MDC9622411.1 hypothetical protein [Xenorhabdus aichiensis]